MASVPGHLNSPPLVGSSSRVRASTDPAARIAYSRHRFPLPKIIGGGKTFIWPVGTETFSRSGSATLGIHKYLGRGYVDVHLVHRDEARIDMEGIFPGLTSAKNMRDLIEILTAPGVKQLYVPGVFPSIQNVFSENYDFRHEEQDRTHSILYRVTFVRTTTQGKVDSKQVALHQAMSEVPANPRSHQSVSSEREVVISDGMTTLRAVADRVYSNAEKWPVLVTLNKELQNWNSELSTPQPAFFLATRRLPLGTRIRY